MAGIWRYIKPHIGFIIFTVSIKLFGTVLELLIPYFMEIILDDVVPADRRDLILLYGGLMLVCAVGCLAANVIANRMSAVSSGKITLKLRHDLFAKMERLSAGQMDKLTVSSAESRLTSDTYNINQLLARMQRLGIRGPILLLGGVIMMVSMDSTLSLVLIGMLPLIAGIVYFVTKKSVPLYNEVQTVLDCVVRVLQENITGIRVIKALSKTDYEKKRFDGVNTQLSDTDKKAGMITGITNPSTSLALNLGLTLVVLIGAFRVNSGNCQSGVIIAFLQYFAMILNAMLGITRIFVMWSKGEASARRVADILNLPEDLTAADADESPAKADAPHIEFRDVSFSYTGIGENLSHLSFKLRRGESLGILGETGAGKSTVLNLLLRFYDPQDGAIFIDGKDIRTISPSILRGRFGAAFQNDFIMAGTFRDNISFFRDVDESAMLSAAKDAQAAELIDASVDVRGNNLSGGQRQRLLIARALASSPEILLLDDSSSALDYRTDAALRKALHKNHRNTTTITIAQRVSSLKSCTHILVLSDGKTIGYGTHEELMSSCAEYRTIAELQMGEGGESA